MRYYSTRNVAELTGTALITARKWAAENVENYLEEGTRKTYIWTQDDITRFQSRNHTVGWKKGVPRKKDILQ